MYRLYLKILLLFALAFGTLGWASITFAAGQDVIQIPPLKAQRTRPLIVIVADNKGTETTDLIVPHGIIRSAGIADVLVVSTHAGAVDLMPALKIQPDTTMSDFDRDHPEGADIVIVPAMHDDRNRNVIAWIRQQFSKRAMVVSICEGAWLAARAGVFEGRHATTHWYAFDKMRRAFPQAQWVRNKRYVVDGNVMSTTGVTASIPASLALVEAIGGRAKAQSVAASLGVDGWSAAHDATPFHMTTGRLWRFAANYLAFWGHETIRLPAQDGFDEIALALAADAWSRTFRSQAVVAEKAASIRSRNGLVLVSDSSAESSASSMEIPLLPPARILDDALSQIAERYGSRTSDIVALQLEYPTRH